MRSRRSARCVRSSRMIRAIQKHATGMCDLEACYVRSRHCVFAVKNGEKTPTTNILVFLARTYSYDIPSSAPEVRGPRTVRPSCVLIRCYYVDLVWVLSSHLSPLFKPWQNKVSPDRFVWASSHKGLSRSWVFSFFSFFRIASRFYS